MRLREKPGLDKKRAPLFIKLLGRAVSVDEGHFDKQGKFVADRPRNGDQLSSGVWMEADVGVVRLIACT